jgi:hypothetical protein
VTFDQVFRLAALTIKHSHSALPVVMLLTTKRMSKPRVDASMRAATRRERDQDLARYCVSPNLNSEVLISTFGVA